MIRKKRTNTNAMQMSLFPLEALPELIATEELSLPVNSVFSDADLEILIVYSKINMSYHGVHDSMRREWLRAWGKERGYPRNWFTIHSKSSGYYQAAIPEGEEAWKHFLENATPFDVYCLFVECYAGYCFSLSKFTTVQEVAELLPHCLNDAGERGEIKLEDIKWMPQYRAMEYGSDRDYERKKVGE